MEVYLVTFYTPDQEEGLNLIQYPDILISFFFPKGLERMIQVKQEDDEHGISI
jgi:hypothetical protein